jgi:hypothetical protein
MTEPNGAEVVRGRPLATIIGNARVGCKAVIYDRRPASFALNETSAEEW